MENRFTLVLEDINFKKGVNVFIIIDHFTGLKYPFQLIDNKLTALVSVESTSYALQLGDFVVLMGI